MKKLTIGICTVSTRPENYLLATISSVLENMSQEAQQEIQIVLFDCDATPKESCYMAETRVQFRPQIEEGLIEIVRTSPSDYPDLDNLPLSFGDSPERIRWRTKMNLDFSLIFKYCAGRGDYYLHLEDDVICAENFYQKMWTDIKRLPDSEWSSIQFCDLGTMGMLFKDKDLEKLAAFLWTFSDELPTDWLMEYFYALRRRQGQEFIRPERTLFQHIGYHSSLKGKISTFRSRIFDRSSHHDRLWAHKETQWVSKMLSLGFIQYRKIRTRAKRVLKPQQE